MTTVRMRHVREAGYCAAGARAFAQRHGFDWPRFLREGIGEQELAKAGDAMADRLIERARREHGEASRAAP